MPGKTGRETYFEGLTRGEKLQFLLDYNIISRQLVLSDEEAKERDELNRNYFTPRKPDGTLDTTEMKSRFGTLLLKKADLEVEFGKEVLKQMAELEGDLTDAEKEMIAIERASKTTLAGYQLRCVNSFVKEELFDKNLLSREEINAFLKANDITVKSARTADKMPEAEQANKDALIAKMDSVYTEIQKRMNRSLDEAGKKAYEIGNKFPVNLSSLSEEKQALAELKGDDKIAAGTAISDYAMGLSQKFENYKQDGLEKQALHATTDPMIISSVSAILHSTGRGDAFWHQNNSEEFEAVLNYMDAFVKVGEGEYNPTALDEAREDVIKAGLKYLDGKESVRSSQFGRDRFEAVLTAMAAVMDAADFQKLADKINKKRGITDKNDPNYVSREVYRAKGSALSRRIPSTLNIDQKYLKETLGFGPLEGEEKYDINGLNGPTGKPFNSRDFAVLASGAAAMHEENPRDLANKAMVDYHFGKKEALAKLIAGSLTAFAKQTKAQDELNTNWIITGEKMATLLDFMARDEELANLTKTAGLDEATIMFSQGAVEAGRIKGKAEIAKERLTTQKDLSDAEKRNLYVDIMKEEYIDSQIAIANTYNDAVQQVDYNLIDADKAFIEDERMKNMAKEMIKGEMREFNSAITNLRNPENRKMITSACRNAASELKPEKLSFQKANSKISSTEFTNQTIKKAVSMEENANKVPKGPLGI